MSEPLEPVVTDVPEAALPPSEHVPMTKRTAAKGVAWNVAFAIPAKLLFPIVGILIQNRVGSQAVGVFAVVSTIFAVTELLREGGLGATYMADPNLDAERERHYAGVSFSTGLIFGGLLLFASPLLAHFFTSPELTPALALASICTIVSSLVAVPANRLQREVRFRDLGAADFTATLVSYATALTLAIGGFGFASLVVQLGARVVVFSILVFRTSKMVKPAFSGEGWKILRSSVSNLSSNLAYFIYTSFDYLLVKKVLGDKANGSYFAAFNIASKPVDLISVPVIRTVFVAYAKAADNPERQAGLWVRATGFLALITIPLYGLLGFHASTIIGVLYGSDFAPAKSALALLAVYLGFRAFGAAAGSALVGTGNPRLNALAWLPGYVVAIGGISYNWGHPTLEGIVGSLAAGAVAVYLMNLAFAFWKLPPTPAQRRVFFSRVSAGLASAGLIGAFKLLPISDRAQLLCALFIGGLVHVAVAAFVLVGDWRKGFSKSGWRLIFDNL